MRVHRVKDSGFWFHRVGRIHGVKDLGFGVSVLGFIGLRF